MDHTCEQLTVRCVCRQSPFHQLLAVDLVDDDDTIADMVEIATVI